MSLERCPGCDRPWDRCKCDAATAQWLAANAPDERLPDEDDTGRLMGGHLCDAARGGKVRQLARLASDMGATVQRVDRTMELESSAGHPLRHYREWIVARLDALEAAERNRAIEVRRLTLQRDLIDEFCDGAGATKEEIGRRRGRSRAWVVDQFQVIEADMRARDVPLVTGRCPCGCGRHVVPSRTGRPRRYATPRCERRAYQRRVRARRRGIGMGIGKAREAHGACIERGRASPAA